MFSGKLSSGGFYVHLSPVMNTGLRYLAGNAIFGHRASNDYYVSMADDEVHANFKHVCMLMGTGEHAYRCYVFRKTFCQALVLYSEAQRASYGG